jgi:cation-transporting ATPase G
MAAASGFLLTVGLVAGTGDLGLTSSVALAGALVLGGSTFVPATLRAARRGRLNVGTLMTIAATGAVALGELGEAAMLAFLFSISEGLEGYALARTRRGLRSLLDLVPLSARVVRDGVEVELDPSELVMGDVWWCVPASAWPAMVSFFAGSARLTCRW